MSRVSNAYLSQVERGIHEPSLRVLRAVAEALDVPLETMVPSDGGTSPALRGLGPGGSDPRRRASQRRREAGAADDLPLDGRPPGTSDAAPWPTGRTRTEVGPSGRLTAFATCI